MTKVITKNSTELIHQNVKPALLIGMDYLFKLLNWKGHALTHDYHEFETRQGNIILQNRQGSRARTTPSLITINSPEPPTIEEMVKNFWDLETLGIRDFTTTTVAEEVHEQFLETIEFKDNRYRVEWLWNGKQDQLPSNIGIAFYRLKAMTLQHHLTKHNSQLFRNTYVDNLIQTGDDEASLRLETQQAKEVFAEASFNLREYYSNSANIMKQFNPAANNEQTTRVLGHKWDFKADQLQIAWPKWKQDEQNTKRTVLSYIAL
ncbi:gag protein [Ditylenchus destructor]|uniref:Gag protein n=1 Tax=Ditylenchus destructor TaxID=166010 RepID=A0AAD4QS16_9BILA|nr:gag protein [Ditylenchus destructor]